MKSSVPLVFELALPRSDPATALEAAVLAERFGFDVVTITDHVFHEKLFGDGFEAHIDPLVTLAAIARATQQVRLGTAFFSVPFVHPVLFARSIATADHFAGGRLEVGVGCGWYQPEFQALGLPFGANHERVAMLEEFLAIVLRLWNGQDASGGERFPGIQTIPAVLSPVQSPHPPLVIGADSPELLALGGRLANTVNVVPSALNTGRMQIERLLDTTAAEICAKANVVQEACTRSGRAAPIPIAFDLQAVVSQEKGVVDAFVSACARRLDVKESTLRDSIATLIGTPAECAEKLSDLQKRLGLSRVSLRFWTSESIECFAHSVLPLFRTKGP